MSYFLLTHPRSGSSNLCVAISKTMSESAPVWNLDEFFHLGNFQTWGDYKKILNSNLTQGVVYGLIDSPSIDISGDISDVKNIRNFLLKEILITRADLISWKNLEMDKRLKFINSLSSLNQSFIVKVFIDSDRWFNFEFPTDHSIILYRKKFIDAMTSMIIKNFYSSLSSRNNFNDRYKGKDFIVPDFSFSLTYNNFVKQIENFFRFLKFCHQHRNINFVCYEDLYSNFSSVEIFGKPIEKEFLDDIDIKLTYSKEKTEYIENFQEVHHWILRKIKEDGLEDICDILEIDHG